MTRLQQFRLKMLIFLSIAMVVILALKLVAGVNWEVRDTLIYSGIILQWPTLLYEMRRLHSGRPVPALDPLIEQEFLRRLRATLRSVLLCAGGLILAPMCVVGARCTFPGSLNSTTWFTLICGSMIPFAFGMLYPFGRMFVYALRIRKLLYP